VHVLEVSFFSVIPPLFAKHLWLEGKCAKIYDAFLSF